MKTLSLVAICQYRLLAFRLDLSAQSLIRTPDGFLTNLSALVTPNANGTSTLNFFNPASNTAQQSFVRLVNSGTESSAVTISGVDDAGQIAPKGDVTLTLAAGQSTELSASDLEQGNANLQLNGSLGVGSGRWRLDVSSDPQISVMSYVLTSTYLCHHQCRPQALSLNYRSQVPLL